MAQKNNYIDTSAQMPDTVYKKDQPFLRPVWELVEGAAVAVVKSKPKDRLATKIPLKGVSTRQC